MSRSLKRNFMRLQKFHPLPLAALFVLLSDVHPIFGADTASSQPAGSPTAAAASPFQFVKGPANAPTLIIEYLKKYRAPPPSRSGLSFDLLKGTPVEAVQVSQPFHTATLPVNGRKAGSRKMSETFVSSSDLLYFLDGSGNTIAQVVMRQGKIYSLGTTGFQRKTLDDLAALPQVSLGKYEPRILNLDSFIGGWAIWLESAVPERPDLIYVQSIGKTSSGLKAKTLYSSDEFLNLMDEAVEKKDAAQKPAAPRGTAPRRGSPSSGPRAGSQANPPIRGR